MPPLPPGLVEAIEAGNCIAFIGSGFSAAGGVPTWNRLLLKLGARLASEDETRGYVERLLDEAHTPSAHDLDEAAQLLEDRFGEAEFRRLLEHEVSAAEGGEAMARREQLLAGIPFKAIITTNYDRFLPESPPVPYHEVLRQHPKAWIARLVEATNGQWQTPVIRIHGRIGDAENRPVITREDYRGRLYEASSHLTFLRSVLATHSVLYLGFSFRDAYLNELRSEVLSMLRSRPPGLVHGAPDAPVAFALLESDADLKVQYFRRHEGVEVVPYPARQHEHFDAFLQHLHDATNPVRRFARELDGLRILWVDPTPPNNELEHRVLREVARAFGGRGATIDDERDHAAALGRVGGYDLVITNWGSWVPGAQRPEAPVPGPWFMRELRRRNAEVPVLVYASDRTRAAEALRLGAVAYCSSGVELYAAVDRVARAIRLERERA